MRRLIAFVLIGVLLVGTWPAFAQDGGEADAALPNIAELLETSAHDEASPEFTYLLAAAEEAGILPLLAEAGPFTVFAPTDAAFEAALAELDTTLEELAHDYPLLLSVLLYHVVPGDYAAADLLALGEANLATAFLGTSLSINAAPDSVSVNGVRVLATDIRAENGTVHIIEGVLLPDVEHGNLETYLREVPETSLAEVILAATEGNTPQERQFEVLLQLLTATDLLDALEDGGPYTIFAPTDEAFAAYLEANNFTLTDVLRDREALAALLAEHVVPFPFLAEDLAHLDGVLLPTLAGTTLLVTVEDDVVAVNGAPILPERADSLARNGVIHAIDAVLLPAPN